MISPFNAESPVGSQTQDEDPKEASRRSVSEKSYVTQGTYATPDTSPEGTPIPADPDELERAVQIISHISASDQAMLNKISELRTIAADARKRASALRSVLRAERGRRERMEAYVRYWQEIAPGWSHRELWADPMRTRAGPGGKWEELSSDEESEHIDNDM